jgi:hypothetical protein
MVSTPIIIAIAIIYLINTTNLHRTTLTPNPTQ